MKLALLRYFLRNVMLLVTILLANIELKNSKKLKVFII